MSEQFKQPIFFINRLKVNIVTRDSGTYTGTLSTKLLHILIGNVQFSVQCIYMDSCWFTFNEFPFNFRIFI